VVRPNTLGHDVSIYGNRLHVTNRADVIKTIIIHDMSGKLIQKAADLSANSFELDVPKPGMYLISVVLSNGERTQKKYIKLE